MYMLNERHARSAYLPSALLPIILACALIAGAGPASADNFSFGIIADPHINGNSEHLACFEAAVTWLINSRPFTGVELVFVVGDIAWGTSGGQSNIVIAKDILDRFTAEGILYVPLPGDNDVHAGPTSEFEQVFNPQFDLLAASIPSWTKAPTPVSGLYFQNMSFDYKGCHFICADFCSRTPGTDRGELYDISGGTWPWLTQDIALCDKSIAENILIMTHVGMFQTGFPEADQYLFSEADLNQIIAAMTPYSANIAANYAGHVHQNWHWQVPQPPDTVYNVYVTDETWYDQRFPEFSDNDITVRWVNVDTNGATALYGQHLVDVPSTPPSLPAPGAFITLAALAAGCALIRKHARR